MFDLSLAEIAIIVVITIIIVKPEDLPEIMRAAGKIFGKIKKMTREFTSILDDVAKDSGLDEAGQQMTKIVDMDGNPRDAYDVNDLKELASKDSPKE